MKRDISQASHKIALLAILVVGILFSLIVVSIKSNIRVEKPIELPFSGFHVPLPAGENWKMRTEQWLFNPEGNYFYMGAIEKKKGVTSTAVQWRYIVCPEGKNITEILEHRGADLGGYSGKKKTIIGDGFGAYLANFRREVGEYVYLALVILEPGRAAELEVRCGDPYYAEDVFNALLLKARFETNGLLNKGRIVTDNAITKSINRSFREPVEKLYLLDSNGLLDGFYGLREMKLDNADAMKSIMYVNIGVYDLNRQNHFSRTLDGRITWKYVQNGSQSDMKREILLEVARDHVLTVTDFTDKKEKELHLGDSYWPEIMDFELFGAFIESDFDECVVDILTKRGEVLPVYLTKTQREDGLWDISMDYFNMPDFERTVTTDRDGMVINRILDADVRHTMNQCAREDILARYPQQSNFLQQLFE
ncbi:MAG: hypothetical protein ACIAQZ_02275 [Sedimentisphaeraceae bacterium JB056]